MPYSAEVYDGVGYLPVSVGAPGVRVHAQIATSAPTARAVGDMWINPNDQLLAWDTDWKYPTFVNGWKNYDASFWQEARYRKTASGVVVMQGLVDAGTVAWGTPIFILPPGYRPAYQLILAVETDPNTGGRMDIQANGYVCAAQGSNGWFSLQSSFYVG